MSWRDRLLPASFRGVPFKVESAEGEHGRQTVRHDYPLRDQPFYEDMGRKAREFRITGFVVGDDYLEQLDALLGAIEEEGAGELVHPYRGTLSVQCLGCTTNESSSEGRMARFTLAFGEAGAQIYPSAEPDREHGVHASGEILREVARAEFVAGLRIERVPEFVREAAAGEVVRLGREIQELGVFGGAAAQVADLRRRLVGLIEDSSDRVLEPFELASDVIGAIDAVAAAAESRSRALDALLALIARGPLAHADILAASNATTVRALIRRGALAGAARAALEVDWMTRQDALAARDILADALDLEAEEASDAAYQALSDLRATVCTAVPPANEDLPELGSVTLAATLPALVVAYELYEDPARAAEIVERNAVRHPGFLPAARPLEVLVDA
jgi:prophage DNA circulation protein